MCRLAFLRTDSAQSGGRAKLRSIRRGAQACGAVAVDGRGGLPLRLDGQRQPRTAVDRGGAVGCSPPSRACRLTTTPPSGRGGLGMIWRKASYGADGQAGSRFVKRMLTMATCRQRGRGALDFLTGCSRSRLDGTLTLSTVGLIVTAGAVTARYSRERSRRPKSINPALSPASRPSPARSSSQPPGGGHGRSRPPGYLGRMTPSRVTG